MKNRTIPEKIAAAFGVITLVLCGMAWFSASQFGTMNAALSYVSEDLVPKLAAAQQMDTATSDFRIAESQHILAIQPADMRAAEQKMAAANAIIQKNYAFLDRTLKRPEARQLLSRFHRQWLAYMGEHQTLIGLSRLNRNNDATNVMRGRSQTLFDQLSDDIGALAIFETKLVVEQRQVAADLHTRVIMLLAVVVLIACAALVAILLMLVQQIARPVRVVTAGLTALAGGDMRSIALDEDRRDEVGQLAAALTNLRTQLMAADAAKLAQTGLIVSSVGAALSRLAEGDLVSRLDSDLDGPFATIKSDFNRAADALQAAMSQVSISTGGIINGAADIRQASDDLSQRTEQQAASLEETAAAMDEITTAVRTTAQQAGRARQMVGQAKDEAQHSGAIMDEAVVAMNGIERASNEISDIISVIDGIAFQTNLLALNAGVEAARAGDAGKGFAVVASEVRALAQRSADAAKDVKERISLSAQQVDAGVGLVNETGKALGRIVERIAEINQLVADIAISAEQQSTGLQQVNTAVGQMDMVTQQNAAMVEEATAAARSLADEAEQLSRQMARFSIQSGGMPGGANVRRLDEDRSRRASTLIA